MAPPARGHRHRKEQQPCGTPPDVRSNGAEARGRAVRWLAEKNRRCTTALALVVTSFTGLLGELSVHHASHPRGQGRVRRGRRTDGLAADPEPADPTLGALMQKGGDV